MYEEMLKKLASIERHLIRLNGYLEDCPAEDIDFTERAIERAAESAERIRFLLALQDVHKMFTIWWLTKVNHHGIIKVQSKQ